MIDIYRKHTRNQITSRLAYDIILDRDFNDLLEELVILYKKSEVTNPEQEAFQDAFYSILNVKENGSRALTVSR